MDSYRDVTPTLKTDDLEATVAFYTEVLGFEIHVMWPEDEPTFCILDHGDVHVSFVADQGFAPGPPAMTGQLSFTVDDALAIHAAVRGRAEVLWGPEVYPYGRREFSIRDPSGYALVFSEPTDDPPTCDG